MIKLLFYQKSKLLFFMRISLLNIALSSMLISIGYAADVKGQEMLDRKVTLDVKNKAVKEVLAQIETQAEVKFTYGPKSIKSNKKVTLHLEDVKISQLLDALFNSDVKYEVIGEQIVLMPISSSDTKDEKLEFQSSFTAFTVTGKVVDETGAALPGVNILEKSTSNGTTSAADGTYSINVTDTNATLVFSFIGYTTQSVAIGGRTVIDIPMIPDIKALQEVVVVGYGEQKKVTVTGSVVAVSGAELLQAPSVNLSNAIAGRMPGVVALQPSGEPGGDNSIIRIRGANTLGNSAPLIVIDGIPDRDGGLNRLSPQDIESLTVLKDASAAIYGARAANGVILITTRKGKSGAPKITYDFNQGWSQPTIIPKMSDAVEYAKIMNELPIYKNIPANEWTNAWSAIKQTGTYDSPTSGIATINANFSPPAVQKYTDGSDPWGHPNTDWFKDALKPWSPQSRHNFQISGGNDDIKYMASVGYLNQDAVYKNSATYYKQYSIRLNVDAKINKYIRNSLGLMIREENRNYPTQSAGSIFRMLMRGRPTEPEVWPNGLPGPDIENGQNPIVITTNQTGYVKNPTNYVQTNTQFEITNPWIENLKLTLMGSLDRSIDRSKTWETPWYLYTWDKVSFESDGKTPKLTKALRSPFTDPRLTQRESTVTNANLTALLNYDRTFGEHTLGVMFGATRETFKGDNFSAYRREFISSAVDQLFAGGPFQLVNGSGYDRARLGYYGRVTYNYREKYMAEFIWRKDGSYIFPKADRFGFFPGLLLGWNISNEDFFSENIKFINFLKVRGSYGQMGNDQVFFNGALQEYAFQSLYGIGQYPINSQVATTVFESTVPNPTFTWEVANNLNIGVDGTALGGKIDFTFEYFFNKRDQILIPNTGGTPGSAGITNLPPLNQGRVDNTGFDFQVAYNGDAGIVKYSVGINGGFARNKVVFMSEIAGAPPYQRQEGMPINAVLVYKSDGAFKDQAAIDANTIDYSSVTSKLLPGDMRFIDYNSDGKINADDMVRLDETNLPTFNFGSTINLQYKNFDLAILLQGATGAVVRLQTESGDIGNFLKYSNDNRWSIDNPSSTDPRLASRGDTYYTGGNYGNNTYFLLSTDYIRLKNLELGYTLPVDIGSKAGISNLRIYVNGLNLFTMAKNKVYDPETTSSSGQYYPQLRVINTGLRLTF